jgi:hypothetical protein
MKSSSLEISFSDVLLLIGVQARTGELELESGNNIGTMLFHQGKILQAFSPYSRAIGDLLVEGGVITDADLLETLKLQKMNSSTPLGALLLKTGKVTFEVIEMMVHEQIRKSVKDFQTWEGLNFSFTNKDIKPFDRIHLPPQEFIPSDTIRAVKAFLARESPPAGMSSTPAVSTNSL